MQLMGLRDRTTSALRKPSSLLHPTSITTTINNIDVAEGDEQQQQHQQQQQNEYVDVLQQQSVYASSSPLSSSSLNLLSSRKGYYDYNGEKINKGRYSPTFSFYQIFHRCSCGDGSSPTSQICSRRFLNLVSVIIFCLDPPFLLYGVIINFWLYHIFQSRTMISSSSSSPRDQSFLRYFTPTAVTIMIIIAALAKKYEVSHKRLYEYDLAHVQKEDQIYYRMIPVDESYGDKFLSAITTISNYMIMEGIRSSPSSYDNENTVKLGSSSLVVEKLPVSNVKSFDNAIRFDFLLEFRNNPQFTAEFGCIMETDFAANLAYVTNAMMTPTNVAFPPPPSQTRSTKTIQTNNTTQQLNRDAYPSQEYHDHDHRRLALHDFLHVQHMWAHRKFEPQNVGLLCVRNKKKKKRKQQQQHDDGNVDSYHSATYYDDLYLDMWLRMMSFLNNRRYCRFLPKSILYWLLPAKRKRILYWDIDHGCTYLFEHCNYIHFTKPKGEAMAQALTYIDREKRKRTKSATTTTATAAAMVDDKTSTAGYNNNNNGLKGVIPGLKKRNN